MGIYKEQVRQAVSSMRFLIDSTPINPEDAKLLEDEETRVIYSSIQKGLSLNAVDIHRRLNNKRDEEKQVDMFTIHEKLLSLVENGFVNVTEVETGFFPLFSPSAKGVRISKNLGI